MSRDWFSSADWFGFAAGQMNTGGRKPHTYFVTCELDVSCDNNIKRQS
jgi:hypothetical protein